MTHKPIAQDTLFYGDNLPVSREYAPDESINLVSLDPLLNPKGTKDERRMTNDAPRPCER
jgi:hypothetical protein